MKKITPEKERQILQECLIHDKKDKLVQHYSALVCHTIRKTLLIKNISFTEADIEDMQQEVFIRLFDKECRRLKQYKEEMGSLAGWIKLIANRTVLNDVRRKGFDVLAAKKNRISFEDFKEESEQLKQDDEFETKENLLEIQDAIEKLPHRERLVLKLHYYQGLSLPEIASFIHRKEGATYTIKSRALKRLKECLK